MRIFSPAESDAPGSAAPVTAALPPAPRVLLTPAELLGKLATGFANPAAMAVEAVLFPLLALGIALLTVPQDPFQIRGAFPWPWLAPLVVALRYGTVGGIAGASVLLAAWFGLNVGHLETFPEVYFLGGLIMVMLTGEFAGVWQTRTHRAETLQFYLEQRFEQLLHQHYLLRLSHDRLARELIGRPMSMHDALVALRDAENDRADGAHGTAALLRVLVQYCQLDCAALYPVKDGRLALQPSATAGACEALDADDPLVRQALETGKLCHINETVGARQDSRYLVAAPLLDLGGATYGLLVVQDMPFLALQNENLLALQLLISCYTDNLSMTLVARPIVDAYPECSMEFAFELQRMARVRTMVGLSSVVLALAVDSDEVAHGLLQALDAAKGELDQTCAGGAGPRHVLACLMPMGDTTAAHDCEAQLEEWAQREHGRSLAQLGVTVRVLDLGDEPPLATVARIHALLDR